MNDTVTVVVSTYGGPEWIDLAQSRAIPSTTGQAPYIHAHGDTLAEARNTGLEAVETEHVLFLDADDELEANTVARLAGGTAQLRVPSVRYVQDGRVAAPRMPKVPGHRHDCHAGCLPDGNFMVVGTWAPTQLLRDVGGWEPWELYEDWALWLRCWKAGATIETVPDAVYRAHVNPASRNRAPDMEFKNRVHWEIVTAVLGPEVATA